MMRWGTRACSSVPTGALLFQVSSHVNFAPKLRAQPRTELSSGRIPLEPDGVDVHLVRLVAEVSGVDPTVIDDLDDPDLARRLFEAVGPVGVEVDLSHRATRSEACPVPSGLPSDRAGSGPGVHRFDLGLVVGVAVGHPDRRWAAGIAAPGVAAVGACKSDQPVLRQPARRG